MAELTARERERLSRAAGVIHGVAVSAGLPEVIIAVLHGVANVIDEILYPDPRCEQEEINE